MPRPTYLSVHLSSDTKEEVKRLAKEEDRSLSNMVEVLVKRALKAQDVPK